jgi:hypothetical protein
MAFRFEFDSVNKVLLARFAGRLTEEVFLEFRHEIREHSAATNPRMGIMDYSWVTQFAISSSLIRELAKQEPPIGNIPRVIVVQSTAGFGLARMFQIAGGPKSSGLKIARSLDEAFAELGVQSPHFELLNRQSNKLIPPQK